jgi:hypothetical protein
MSMLKYGGVYFRNTLGDKLCNIIDSFHGHVTSLVEHYQARPFPKPTKVTYCQDGLPRIFVIFGKKGNPVLYKWLLVPEILEESPPPYPTACGMNMEKAYA